MERKDITELRTYNSRTYSVPFHTYERFFSTPFGTYRRYYGELETEFHVKPIHYFSTKGDWRPLGEIASYFGNKKGMVLREGWEEKVDFGYLVWYLKRLQLLKGGGILLPYTRLPLVLNTVSTFYPAAGANSPVDGRAFISTTNETWANIRGNAGNGSGDIDASTEPVRLRAGTTTDLWNIMVRGFTLFDTSSIPDADSISAATISFYVEAVQTNATLAQSMLPVQLGTAPASNAAIVNSDYNIGGWNTTALATSIAISSLTTSAYNDWTLNATGRDQISKTGVSKFGWMLNSDQANTAASWAASADTYATCSMADTAGTAQDPKLVVTHAVAGGSNASLLLLGVGL